MQGMAFAPLFCALFRGHNAPMLIRQALESKSMVFVNAVRYSPDVYHFLSLSVASMLFGPRTLTRPVEALLLIATGTVGSYRLAGTLMRRLGTSWATRLSSAAVTRSTGVEAPG